MNKPPEIADAVTPEQMNNIVSRLQTMLPMPSHNETARCDDGKTCRIPLSGGACSQCGYPIAYAHPSSVLDAFRVEAVWIGGTAILVEPQKHIPPDVVRILRRDGSFDEHSIPEADEEMEQASEILDVHIRWPLLLLAARLLCEDDETAHRMLTRQSHGRPRHEDDEAASKLSDALVAGIWAMSHGWLSHTQRSMLEHFTGPPGAKPLVQRLLREVDRRERLDRSITGPGLTVDDNRPRLDVEGASVGSFLAPLSRIRIALLPGEADHVELYDIRVGERKDYPIGTSVISRLPGYGPETVREIPDRVDIGGTLIGRYLPGAALAGQLRDGADASHPARLSPEDLLEGVKIDLGRTFPPMSCVYLFYRVAPGHVFCAVVEPIRDETTMGAP
jgi:hypothetical protein